VHEDEGISYRLRIDNLVYQMTPRTHQNIHLDDHIQIFRYRYQMASDAGSRWFLECSGAGIGGLLECSGAGTG
jgi:hypothetical protein